MLGRVQIQLNVLGTWGIKAWHVPLVPDASNASGGDVYAHRLVPSLTNRLKLLTKQSHCPIETWSSFIFLSQYFMAPKISPHFSSLGCHHVCPCIPLMLSPLIWIMLNLKKPIVKHPNVPSDISSFFNL